MNPMATSKADILKTSRELIQQNGWAAVNIRAVAAACGVSVGCIYNYFGSKTELVSAAVESIWNDIFRHPEDEAVFQDTLSCIRWMYRQMEYGCQQYPGFFTHHALGFVRQDTANGKQQMRQTWQHILDALCSRTSTPLRCWRSCAGPFIKQKNIPQALWEFFKPECEHSSIWFLRPADYTTASPFPYDASGTAVPRRFAIKSKNCNQNK